MSFCVFLSFEATRWLFREPAVDRLTHCSGSFIYYAWCEDSPECVAVLQVAVSETHPSQTMHPCGLIVTSVPCLDLHLLATQQTYFTWIRGHLYPAEPKSGARDQEAAIERHSKITFELMATEFRARPSRVNEE